MDIEKQFAKLSSRRGVAMFVVLGAIVMVTLFGYVGLTLVGKDQTLSGDLNDIKSRDEAAIAGLQLGINRLAADPVQMVALLDSFISEGRKSTAAPKNTWFDLTDNTLKLKLVKDEPDWFALSATTGNKSAAKLKLLAISQGDTLGMPDEDRDSGAVYISLLCQARGRHGDQKIVQATYRIHGVSLAYEKGIVYYTVPQHSFYIGGTYKSANLKLGAEGNVFIGGADNSFLNSGAGQTINGDLKWNDDLKINTDDVHVLGNMYVNGSFYTNGGALIVEENAGIANGFDVMDGKGIWIKKNLWVGGTGLGNAWNPTHGTIRVGGDFVFIPSDMKTPHNLVVKGNAWLQRASNFTINSGDSFYIGKSLYYGNNIQNMNHSITAPFFKVDSSLIFSGGGTLTVPGGAIGDTLQVNRTLNVNGTLNVVKVAQVDVLSAGSINGSTAPRGGVLNWVPAPSPIQLGLSASLQNTDPVDNPMDSVKVDMLHSPMVASKVLDLTPALFQSAFTAAGVTGYPTTTISADNLNFLFKYLSDAGALLNGYMVLKIPFGTPITNFSDVSTVGFKGKMLVIIEAKLSINHMWPHSETRQNIQVILARKGGEINSFGWSFGDFAGVIYWENPSCESHSLEFQQGTLYGAVLMGTHLKVADYGYSNAEVSNCETSFTPNAGSLNVQRDLAVFEDIGRGLPGILAPARDAFGVPITALSTATTTLPSPFIRLVHTNPYFEPIGVFR